MFHKMFLPLATWQHWKFHQLYQNDWRNEVSLVSLYNIEHVMHYRWITKPPALSAVVRAKAQSPVRIPLWEVTAGISDETA